MAKLLQCALQKYHWGKLGQESAVGCLAENNIPGFKADADTTYAELWMGTHPNGPSILEDGTTLSQYIESKPEVLGNKILETFGTKLPFLFKVLSVNTSLSIQVHPNKKHAEELHARFPDRYKDDNHKPELAIALTEFEGLCGFRPARQIQAFARDVPELQALLGLSAQQLLSTACDDKEAMSQAIRESFSSLMSCEKSAIAEKVTDLCDRLSKSETLVEPLDERTRSLLLRLNSQYPGDVGVFAVFFLNHLSLQPGQAIFLSANLPHAYLHGDCIECMATSDNVVRAGLTPKFKDIETLVAMLDYSPNEPESFLMQTESQVDDENVKIFKSPLPDFSVLQIKVPAPCPSYPVAPYDSASIVIFVRGSAQLDGVPESSCDARPGRVLFVPAGGTFLLKNVAEEVLAYRALCL